jgi:hypothetical protein
MLSDGRSNGWPCDMLSRSAGKRLPGRDRGGRSGGAEKRTVGLALQTTPSRVPLSGDPPNPLRSRRPRARGRRGASRQVVVQEPMASSLGASASGPPPALNLQPVLFLNASGQGLLGGGFAAHEAGDGGRQTPVDGRQAQEDHGHAENLSRLQLLGKHDGAQHYRADRDQERH